MRSGTRYKLHPFGTIVHAYIPQQRRRNEGKLAPRSTIGCLVGFQPSSTHEPSGNYKFWDLERKCFDISHNVKFTNKFPKASDFEEPLITPSLPTSTESSSSDPSEPPEIFDEIEVLPPPPQTFSAKSEPPNGDPATYEEALRRPDAQKWIEAMEEEMNSIDTNKTWVLSDLPRGRKCIGTKWVFRTKRDGNNKLERYKCRIVAKGYAQIAGIDFDKTFAPVARIESVRCFLSLAAYHGLDVKHVDCKNAFLHGNSDLEIYVQQPQGFVSKKYPNKVLRLNKSLYGLKQAPRIWYLLLFNVIQKLGFIALESDTSIYYLPSEGIILAVYVDDILIFSPEKSLSNELFGQLQKHLKIQDLGFPKTFLGLNIVRHQNGSISINQSGYIHRMLTRFQMENAYVAPTPLHESTNLLDATPYDKMANMTLYQEIIGSLNHLAVYSRPDISNAVSQLSQFMQNPTETHMKSARYVLRYLKGTQNLSITYGRSSSFRIHGFSDANWGGDKNDRKSTTGYLFMVNSGAVSWTSHKQSTVAISTMEAEYMALSDATREAIARSQLFNELYMQLPSPTVLSDNQGALDISEDPTNYQRAKHIDIRYHFIRHAINNGEVSVDYIPSAENPADILTKALGKIKHSRCLELMNLR
jgi:hypothetical protein